MEECGRAILQLIRAGVLYALFCSSLSLQASKRNIYVLFFTSEILEIWGDSVKKKLTESYPPPWLAGDWGLLCRQGGYQ